MAPRIWDGYEVVRQAKAPREMFALHTTRLYLVNGTRTGKFHTSSRCAHVRAAPGRYLCGTAVPAAGVPETRVCVCLPNAAPEVFAEIVAPAQLIGSLATSARRLAGHLKADRPLPLADVATLRSAYAGYQQARGEVLAALLAATENELARSHAMEAACVWMDTVLTHAHGVLARVQRLTDADPTRVHRDAASALLGKIEDGHHHKRHRALTVNQWRCDRSITDAAQRTLADGLENVPADTPDGALAAYVADLRDEALTTVDDAEPRDLDQLPDVEIPAGMTLRAGALHVWRAAARAELAELLDPLLTRYLNDVADTEPAILVTGGTDEKADGLLLDCPHVEVSDRRHAYLVPRVVGRAVGAGERSVWVPAAPLPAHLATSYRHGHLSAEDVLGSVYVTTLARLLDELAPDDAVTAALGISDDRVPATSPVHAAALA